MQIELAQDELAYIVAAIGPISEPLNVELYEKLYYNLDSRGIIAFHDYRDRLVFASGVVTLDRPVIVYRPGGKRDDIRLS